MVFQLFRGCNLSHYEKGIYLDCNVVANGDFPFYVISSDPLVQEDLNLYQRS